MVKDYLDFMNRCLKQARGSFTYRKNGVFLRVEKDSSCYYDIIHLNGAKYSSLDELYSILCYWAQFLLTEGDLDKDWIHRGAAFADGRSSSCTAYLKNFIVGISPMGNQVHHEIFYPNRQNSTGLRIKRILWSWYWETQEDAMLTVQNMLKLTKAHEWVLNTKEHLLITRRKPSTGPRLHIEGNAYQTLCNYLIQSRLVP